jgi:hypothetical protein
VARFDRRTGEFSLENKIAEIEAVGRKRGRGGQVSRILDIEARGVEKTDRGVEIRRKDPFDGEKIDSATLVDAIKEQARDNYGPRDLHSFRRFSTTRSTMRFFGSASLSL